MLELLPVSGGDDIVDWGSGRVGPVSPHRLAKTEAPGVGEHQPVSRVELRQRTLLHNLVHVVPGWTPQAAAEHRLIWANALG